MARSEPIMYRVEPEWLDRIDRVQDRLQCRSRADAVHQLVKLGDQLEQIRDQTRAGTPQAEWLNRLYAAAEVTPR